jgi:organic radical activating enzyme
MYKEMASKYDTEAIIGLINGLNSNFSIKEYVLTGGEPFANLEVTKKAYRFYEKALLHQHNITNG